ncbi:MAG TPA: hypothetical protein PKK43_15105 [Spirochaetota bacterium]|nr:hypothetical protein [Spirochaetota bacterium]
MKRVKSGSNAVPVILAAVLIAVIFSSAFAKLVDVKKIPNGKKNSCANCHLPGSDKSSDKLTPFGNDYRANGKKWDAVLAKKDSDGDGMTNGQELCDPDGAWKKDDSNPDGTVFNPGDPASHK